MSPPSTISAMAHAGTEWAGSVEYAPGPVWMVTAGVGVVVSTVPVQATVWPMSSRRLTVHGSAPLPSPGALMGSTAAPPGSTVSMKSRNSRSWPPARHETVPLARAKVWPVLRTWTYRRGRDPMDPAVTAGTTSLVRSRASEPTVMATPTVTWSMTMTLTDTCPCDLRWTERGGAAATTVMPARYCPGGVPAGTATRNPRARPVPGARVTVAGSPVTQQPTPVHAREKLPNALPEFAAVIPRELPTISRSVLVPSSLTIAMSRADPPGAIVSLKYGRGTPAAVGTGERPNDTTPGVLLALAGASPISAKKTAAVTAATANLTPRRRRWAVPASRDIGRPFSFMVLMRWLRSPSRCRSPARRCPEP